VAFVRYRKPEDAQIAIRKLNGKRFDGHEECLLAKLANSDPFQPKIGFKEHQQYENGNFDDNGDENDTMSTDTMTPSQDANFGQHQQQQSANQNGRQPQQQPQQNMYQQHPMQQMQQQPHHYNAQPPMQYNQQMHAPPSHYQYGQPPPQPQPHYGHPMQAHYPYYNQQMQYGQYHPPQPPQYGQPNVNGFVDPNQSQYAPPQYGQQQQPPPYPQYGQAYPPQQQYYNAYPPQQQQQPPPQSQQHFVGQPNLQQPVTPNPMLQSAAQQVTSQTITPIASMPMQPQTHALINKPTPSPKPNVGVTIATNVGLKNAKKSLLKAPLLNKTSSDNTPNGKVVTPQPITATLTPQQMHKVLNGKSPNSVYIPSQNQLYATATPNQFMINNINPISPPGSELSFRQTDTLSALANSAVQELVNGPSKIATAHELMQPVSNNLFGHISPGPQSYNHNLTSQHQWHSANTSPNKAMLVMSADKIENIEEAVGNLHIVKDVDSEKKDVSEEVNGGTKDDGMDDMAKMQRKESNPHHVDKKTANLLHQTISEWYPKQAGKLTGMFLQNHDQARVAKYLKAKDRLKLKIGKFAELLSNQALNEGK